MTSLVTSREISHTFDEFFNFHLQLLGHFPEEAGLGLKEDKTERVLPELPGQMMFVSEAVAKNRRTQLEEYLMVSLLECLIVCVEDFSIATKDCSVSCSLELFEQVDQFMIIYD